MNLQRGYTRWIVAFFFLLWTPFSFAQAIQGAGSKFPYPLYEKWFASFRKLHPSVKIDYKPIGSSAGIERLMAGTSDFAATNAPITEEQLRAIKLKLGKDVLLIPTVAGAVVPIYKVDGVNTDLKFTGSALAGIYLGSITKWNAPEIVDANPGVSLPNAKIIVVHRSDTSDTSYLWTTYLSQMSPAWKAGPGAGVNVRWPTGLGTKGDDGVADLVIGPTGDVGVTELVSSLPNSIGYVQLRYAIDNQLPYGDVQNSSGAFVRATASSITAAGASNEVLGLSGNPLANEYSQTAYPLSSFTWLLIPVEMKDKTKANAMADFLKWMLTEGQQTVEPLHYARIPKNIVAQALTEIARLQ